MLFFSHTRCVAWPRQSIKWAPLWLAIALTGCQALTPAPQSDAPSAPRMAVAPCSPPGALAQLGAPEGGLVQVGFQEAAPDDDSKLPPIGAPVVPRPIQVKELDLCMALDRAGIDNPTIALAQEVVRASEAVQLQAQALLLPTLRGGMNAHVHQGTLLSSLGIVHQVNVQSFYVGAGSGAVVAGTVAFPGVQIFAQFADAYYAPQAAQQQAIARRFDSLAVRNRTLLEVGTAYLELAVAQATLQALQRSEEDVNVIVEITANFAKTGEGRESDAQRARTNWLLLEAQAEQAQGAIQVAAADLARLLNVDPSVELVSADAVPPILEIIDPAMPLPQLLETAMTNHPELGARSADIAAAQIHVQQERMRPWLPLVSLGFSAGNFGGAGQPLTGQSWSGGGRLDVDLIATWSLQNLGLGNRALQNQARASVSEAEAERLRAVNRIREEVVTAYTMILARRREVDIARRRAATSQRAFDEDLLRTRNLKGRPIEVLRSVEMLVAARLALVRAMAGYSEAQLQLFVALGRTPTCTH